MRSCEYKFHKCWDFFLIIFYIRYTKEKRHEKRKCTSEGLKSMICGFVQFLSVKNERMRPNTVSRLDGRRDRWGISTSTLFCEEFGAASEAASLPENGQGAELIASAAWSPDNTDLSAECDGRNGAVSKRSSLAYGCATFSVSFSLFLLTREENMRARLKELLGVGNARLSPARSVCYHFIRAPCSLSLFLSRRAASFASAPHMPN